MPSLTIAPIYVGLVSLLFLGLSVRVMLARRSQKVSIGTGDNALVERAMRLQANCLEYSAFALLLLVVLELQGTPALVLHIFGAAFILARISHAYGMHSVEAPGIYRVAGVGVSVTLIGLMALGSVLHALF